jgi:signal peptidase I
VEGDGVRGGPAQAADDGDDDEWSDAPPPTKKRMSWLTEIVVLVVVALVIALTVKTYIVQPFKIPSASMEDTLLINDKVLVNKLVGHISQIHHGDIVVFNGAGNWDPPVRRSDNPLDRIYRNVLGLFGNDSGQVDYIKRVIGLPGDRVRCCTAAGLMTVNGVALHEKSYLYPGSAPSSIRFSIVVPPGRLWVMGDNRGDSSDSRLHDCAIRGSGCDAWDRDGTVPESSVIGRAFMVAWPLSKVRMLWVPTTFSPVPAGAVPLGAGVLVALPLTLAGRRLRRGWSRKVRRPRR